MLRKSAVHKSQKKANKKSTLPQKNVTKTKTNTVKIRVKKHFRQNEDLPVPALNSVIAIRNKSLFETDSETDGELVDKNLMNYESDKTLSNSTFDQKGDENKINSFLKENFPNNSNIRKKVLFQADPLLDEHDSEAETKFNLHTN